MDHSWKADRKRVPNWVAPKFHPCSSTSYNDFQLWIAHRWHYCGWCLVGGRPNIRDTSSVGALPVRLATVQPLSSFDSSLIGCVLAGIQRNVHYTLLYLPIEHILLLLGRDLNRLKQTESESPIWRPLTSTPVVPPATSSSGLPTGGTTVGGALLGATQILGTPDVLVPDPFGTLPVRLV